MNHWQGKWALITGASAGIGTALARELAAGGTNLVLTARRRDRLVGLAAELSAKNNIRTLVCVADLAQPLGPQQIFSFTEEKNIAIDLLVNNAGFGAYGEFHKVRRRPAHRNDAGQCDGGRARDASLLARNDRARQRGYSDRGFHGGVSGGALHLDVRRDENV